MALSMFEDELEDVEEAGEAGKELCCCIVEGILFFISSVLRILVELSVDLLVESSTAAIFEFKCFLLIGQFAPLTKHHQFHSFHNKFFFSSLSKQ